MTNVLPFHSPETEQRRRRIYTLREMLRNLFDDVLDPEERRDAEEYLIERLRQEGAEP